MDDFAYQALSFYEQIYTLPLFRFGLIVVAILFLLFSIGLIRQHYFHLTMRGANFGFLAGVLFTLVLETAGLFLLLYGPRGIEIVMGRRSRGEIAEMTKEGVGKIGAVLGQASCSANQISATSILEQLPKLSKAEEDKVLRVLCRSER